MSPEVSVIIPLYNKGPYIARAINSVLAQTIQDFEIIVVDDHSSDGGPAIAKGYPDPRISFIEQDHRGVSYTRNHGVDLAKSDFIAFLDADDELMPNHLEILFRLKKRFPEAGIYTSAYQKCLKSGKLEYAHYRAIPQPPYEGLLPNYFRSATFGQDPVSMSTAGMLKAVFFETGGFPVGEAMGEDLDFLAKIALKYPIAFSSEVGAIIHEEASNRACDTYHPFEEFLIVKNGKKAIADGSVPQKMLPDFERYIERKELGAAKYHILRGNYPLGVKLLARTETHYFWGEKVIWSIIVRIPKPVFDRIKNTKYALTDVLQGKT
jgi:glycosyltransferase involved in cell wall biosynthesis